MEHASDSASTSRLPPLVASDSDDSSVGIPLHDDLVVILPPHTSPLLQPLDTPTFGGYSDYNSEVKTRQRVTQITIQLPVSQIWLLLTVMIPQ